MSFIAPFMLPLLALASVPIIIHLLNRRRFQVVEWAPMKYLKLTIKSNRRRLRIEQIILLVIRTLMVMLVIFAVARPVLSPTGLGSWLSGRSRTSRIIVIDDSMSMGYREGGRTAFDSAKEVATQIINSTGTQDEVTALLTSNPSAPFLRDVHLDEVGRVVSAMNAFSPSDGPSDWAAIFHGVDDQLSGSTFPTKEVVLITDLRKSGWDAHVSEFARKWADQRVSMKVIDVGSRQTNDVSIASLESQDALALPNSPVNLVAQIRNNTPNAVSGAQAMLTMNGEARPVVLPNLSSGETTEVPLTVTPTAAGQFPIKLSLPADALAADDTRYFCLTVRPTLDIMLIDGQPSPQPFESETDYLNLAYTIGAEPWRVTHVTEGEWDAVKNAAADEIVLANVGSIPPERVKELERLVSNGAGLMIFCGEQMDTTSYNERLFNEGKGLLPAKLDGAIDGPVSGLVVEALQNSPLILLSKIAPAELANLKINRFMSVEDVKNSPDVRVLARWNNSQNAPAVIEKRFGRGKVLLFTVTANKGWSDWPVQPSFVLATRSAATAIARGISQQENITAGQAIQFVLPPGETATDAKIRNPDGEGAPLQLIPKTDSSPAVLSSSNSAKAGSYVLTWKDSAGKDQTRMVCVSADKSESNLDPITERELAGMLDPLDVTIVHYEGVGSLSDKGREIWRTLAVALLALACVETVFAVWVGRER